MEAEMEERDIFAIIVIVHSPSIIDKRKNHSGSSMSMESLLENSGMSEDSRERVRMRVS